MRITKARLFRGRATYANVMSTIAVFVALGGTSYAVTQLPRDSVGSSQIKRNAVRSPEIRNGSLRLGDFGSSTREALRGQKGDAGPPGASAAKFFAAVSAAGATTRGNATSASHTSVGSGSYTIAFGQNVSACVYTATLGTTDGTTAPAGRVTVRDDAGSVGVQTYDAAANAADLPFHLAVFC